MKFIFLPALSSRGLSRWGVGGLASEQSIQPPSGLRIKSAFKDLRMGNWMDRELKGTPVYYPHALVSYYYFRRVALQLPSDGYIFGDSGGFSLKRHLEKGLSMPGAPMIVRRSISPGGIIRGGAVCKTGGKGSGPQHTRRFDPTDVLRWQADLCSAGAVLDWPPTTQKGDRIWGKAVAATRRNVKKALPLYLDLLRQGTSFRWWGVVHGWTQPNFDKWWERISEVYPFTADGEGWAFSAKGRPHDAVGLARCLHFIKRKEMLRAHFFAALAPHAITVLCALGSKTSLEFISIDAESAGRLARNRRIYVPHEDGLDYGYLGEAGQERRVRDFLLSACKCFSCDGLREDKEKYPEAVCNEYNEYWSHRFHYHNQIIVRRIIKALEQEATKHPEEMLKRMLPGLLYGRVLKAFDGHESKDSTDSMPTDLLDYQ